MDPTPVAEATKLDLPLPWKQVKLTELSRGGPCSKCSKGDKSILCQLVLVQKGQTIKIGPMPFRVETNAKFEVCIRCGTFYLYAVPPRNSGG